ncbi:hypothetical protein NLU13_6112 [Sarocladium strictum]|uniref:Uncharacterized protein n=1 Tax=Sarocladium strictum TaxID=5046 RepID=A0AA39GFA2_SARSR|nr:hypothetical protein NLU13_6112 [Sarocladium strictum]
MASPNEQETLLQTPEDGRMATNLTIHQRPNYRSTSCRQSERERGLKSLASGLMRSGASKEQAFLICGLVSSEESPSSDLREWNDIPLDLRDWIQAQEGLRIDGIPVTNVDSLTRTHRLLCRKQSEVTLEDSGILALALDIAIRLFKQVELIGRDESKIADLEHYFLRSAEQVTSLPDTVIIVCRKCQKNEFEDQNPRWTREPAPSGLCKSHMGRPRVDADRSSTYKRPSGRRTSSAASLPKVVTSTEVLQKGPARDAGLYSGATTTQHDLLSSSNQDVAMDEYFSVLHDSIGPSFPAGSDLMQADYLTSRSNGSELVSSSHGPWILCSSPSYTNSLIEPSTTTSSERLVPSSYTLSSTPSSHQNLDLGQPPTSEPCPDDVAEEGPRPKKKRREGDSQGTSREEGSSSTSLIDTYSQLAYVLSGLRASTAREKSRLGVDQRVKLEQAFTCVSTLCDILKGSHMSRLLETPRGLTSSCVLLASSIIAMVVERYHEQSNRFHSQRRASPDTPEPTTQHQAQCQMEAIVMELHLAKLQVMLSAMGSVEHEPHIMDLLVDTRKRLRAYLEDWSLCNAIPGDGCSCSYW